MVRRVLMPVVLAALAGCGGSPDAPDERPRPDRPPTFGELRSPDARSPLVSTGEGAWRCPTPGRVQLSISAEGEATLIGDRPLAVVTRSRTLVNRECDRDSGAAAGETRTGTLGGRIGASTLRCRAPAIVLVELRGGDLSVRTAGGARFLARAAVRPDRIGVAGYWGAGCAPV
jgi:hypothetical protein